MAAEAAFVAINEGAAGQADSKEGIAPVRQFRKQLQRVTVICRSQKSEQQLLLSRELANLNART